ncbi:MAG TPA: hypothetical protein VGO67_12335 [Verrucomicrobiae bacterium]|jgi:hypothetical protein
MDFEEANPAAIGNGNSASVLFPNWQVLVGGTPTSVVGYNTETLGAPFVSMWDDKLGYVPIQGDYTAFLQSARLGSQSATVGLSQTGLVPEGTESIQLDANQEEGSSFVVMLGGNVVPMSPVQSFSGYTLYEGNASEWAGQSVALTITELPPDNQEFSPNLLQLDNISFSPNPITITPEPDALTLMSVGGLLFGIYRRIQRIRKC